jgi:serine/threonine protein phosphatase 1
MYDKFIQLLDKVQYNSENDLLVLLGDYVDRGPEPMKVVQKVMELVNQGAIALKGNHEEMFLWAEKEGLNTEYWDLHIHNGGTTTWDKFLKLVSTEQQEVLQFISKLDCIFMDDNYIFVHAGINPAFGYQQDTNDLLWIRNGFLNNKTNLKETVIFGHTVTSTINGLSQIWNSGDKIGIDCGCVYGGQLACLELPNMKEWYV